MQAYRKDDQSVESSEQVQDLDFIGEEAQKPHEVKGGFNPQPEPPKYLLPAVRPIYNLR